MESIDKIKRLADIVSKNTAPSSNTNMLIGNLLKAMALYMAEQHHGAVGGYQFLNSIDALPTGDLTDKQKRTGYVVGENIYFYVGTDGDTLDGEYQNGGSFHGTKGDDGLSAYEIWKAIPGNENKTQDEFLASLKESGFTTEAVDTLPTTNISTTTIYAVPEWSEGLDPEEDESDMWAEYIRVDNVWKLLARHNGSGLSSALADIADLKSSTGLNSLRISELSNKTRILVVTEEGGLYVVDKNGNIAFKVVMGNVDALGLGENLISIILELIRNNADLTPALNLIERLEGAVQVIKEKTNLFNVVTNKEGLCLVDENGNVGWQIIPIVTGENGTYFTDKKGNIGMSIVDGLFEFSGFGKKTLSMLEAKMNSKKLQEAFFNTDQNVEDLRRLKGEIEESVNSLATMIDTSVPTEDRVELTVSVPPSTTNTDVAHGMVRLGLHWGSKPSFVNLSAVNNNLAIWDDIYFSKKCRKDFSDIRVFDANGNMLPIYMVHHGNYEVIQDNSFYYQTVLADSAGNLYSSYNRSTDNGRTWTQFHNKQGSRIYHIDEVSGNGYFYLFAETENSTYVHAMPGDIVRIPMINYELNTSRAEVICHTWYNNYYYHAGITIQGTANESGALVLQASPSSNNINRYEIPIEQGMTGAEVCALIANLDITGWTAAYSSGNTVTLNSDSCLIYINPDIEGGIDGLVTSVAVSKDGAQPYYPPLMRRHYCSYTRDGHKYMFIASYQEPTNVWIQRSIDDGPFTTVFDNQDKYEVTGRNGQHIHHISYDSYHGIIYVGIDHSANKEFGPSVIKSFDNGATWVNFEFTEAQEKTDINAKIWKNHRSRDFTPCWFSEDGSFSLGGGETNVLGGYTLLRIDNADAVIDRTQTLASLIDKKFEIAVNNGCAIRAAIASIDDRFIVVPIVAGETHTTAQLLLSTDKGHSWKTIWHHEDALSAVHVGSGPRHSCVSKPVGDERQIIFTGASEDDNYSPLRVYAGGEHYYGEILVDVGTLPAEGMELTVKNGFAMKYPNKIQFDRNILVKPDYSIVFDSGIGDNVTDSIGNSAKIVGDYEWLEDEMPYGNLIPAIVPYKMGYGIRLGLGAYINFGKIKNLDFSDGFTVVMIMNDHFRGNVARDEDYYGLCPIVKFGNDYGIYIYAAGFAVGSRAGFSYCTKNGPASSLVGIPNVQVVRVSASEFLEDTDRPVVDVRCGNMLFTASATRKSFGNGAFPQVNPSECDLIVGITNTERGYRLEYNHPKISISEIHFFNRELTDEEVDSIVFGYTRRYERNY